MSALKDVRYKEVSLYVVFSVYSTFFKLSAKITEATKDKFFFFNWGFLACQTWFTPWFNDQVRISIIILKT